MQIMVITSCTSKKDSEPCPAEDMYKGPQHIKLMPGIREIRKSFSPNSIDLQILSAGYGLIPGGQVIAPYNCTFAKMKGDDLGKRAKELNVPTDFRRVVARQYDLGILLLGDKYMSACDIDDTVQFNNTTIAFCGTAGSKRLKRHRLANLQIVELRISKNDRSLNSDFSCTNDALKGELAARLLKSICAGKLSLTELAKPAFDLLEALRRL